MKILTIGTFDVLQDIDKQFLKKCAKLGNVTVGVNTDVFASARGISPKNSLAERMSAIAALGYEVVENSSPGVELVFREHPEVIAATSGWASQDYLSHIDISQEWLDHEGIIIAYVPL